MQVRTVLPSQLRVPGMQTQLEHMPVAESQPVIAGQAIGAAYPRPSSLHRRTEVPVAHDAAAGVHTCGTQRPSRQLWALGQGVAA